MKVGAELTPMQALEKFYDGETLGVWEGDFIKNEKTRNLKLPLLLKEFLGKYAYLNVNRGSVQLWAPDKIDTDKARVDGELRDILIIGKFQDSLVAILADGKQERPVIYFDELPEEDENGGVTLVFKSTPLDLEELLRLMVLESPTVYDNSVICNEPQAVRQIAETATSEDGEKKVLLDLIENAERPSRHIYWDEDAQEFVAIILASEHEVLVKFPPCFAVQELENIFTKEFYENSANCDFEHALKILKKLIDHFERVEGVTPVLGEKYRLAGRCAWALKQWGEAEDYYRRAEKIYSDELESVLEKIENFYEGMGNFYRDREDISKSEAAYAKVDRFCEFSGKSSVRLKGNRLIRQAMTLAEGNQNERAIELYDQALEIYKADPKDCKYDIARCQQLRGEAKRALKITAGTKDRS